MSLAAEPAKKSPARRGYDFSRPDPGEILPNPKDGVGIPPQLRTYVTVKEMASKDAPAKTRPPASAEPGVSTAKPASSETAEPVSASAPGPETPTPSTAAPEQDAWRSSQTARVSRHVESILAGQIGDHGIDGTFQFEPSAAAQHDPTLLAAETRTWDRVVQSLELSRAAWQAAHPSTGPASKGAGSPAAASVAPALAVEPTELVQTSPGLFLLKGAPSNVTGDIADISP